MTGKSTDHTFINAGVSLKLGPTLLKRSPFFIGGHLYVMSSFTTTSLDSQKIQAKHHAKDKWDSPSITLSIFLIVEASLLTLLNGFKLYTSFTSLTNVLVLARHESSRVFSLTVHGSLSTGVHRVPVFA